MATITEGRFRNPRTGTAEPARVVAPIAKMYEFATTHTELGYRCLGVVGNTAHLLARTPGDHTWFSRHTTFRIPGGPTLYPRHGFIYAGDWYVPEPEKFEQWFLARLRAGYYLDVFKYINILNRHWNRKAIRDGKMFAYPTYSGDHHLHTSCMPGAEYAVVDLFGDYEHYRTTGRNRLPAPAGRPRVPAPPKPSPIDAAARNLKPGLRKGDKGRLVAVAQAGLVGYGFLPDSATSIDGDFGAATDKAVRRLQADRDLPVTGIIDTPTWDKLFPEDVRTVIRGTTGRDALLMQALLLARGYNPGALDGEFYDTSVTALKRFQVAAKVTNSVVKGKGDGIGGDATWVALLTL